jgi:hypothetical protein
VQRSDGSIDDPSLDAGMGQHRGVNGAAVPIMFQDPQSVSGAYIVRPKIALRPVRGAVQARADMPWHWREHLEDEPTPTDYAMTTLHTAPVAQTALVGALDGACELAIAGGYADPEHVDRLCCIADAVAGADYAALQEVYGDEHAQAAAAVVGSFFGSLAKGIAKGAGSVVKAASPMLKMAAPLVNFVPGVGPIASMALQHGLKALPSGGGGGGRPAAAPGVQIYKPPPGSPFTPPGAAATLFPTGGGRLRPGGAELLRSLIFFDG